MSRSCRQGEEEGDILSKQGQEMEARGVMQAVWETSSNFRQGAPEEIQESG